MVSPKNPHRVVVADGVEVNDTQFDDVCVAVTDGDWFDDADSKALRANARLIASAPEMLAILVDLNDWVGSDYREGSGVERMAKIRAVIAKATQVVEVAR